MHIKIYVYFDWMQCLEIYKVSMKLFKIWISQNGHCLYSLFWKKKKNISFNKPEIVHARFLCCS